MISHGGSPTGAPLRPPLPVSLRLSSPPPPRSATPGIPPPAGVGPTAAGGRPAGPTRRRRRAATASSSSVAPRSPQPVPRGGGAGAPRPRARRPGPPRRECTGLTACLRAVPCPSIVLPGWALLTGIARGVLAFGWCDSPARHPCWPPPSPAPRQWTGRLPAGICSAVLAAPACISAARSG